MRTDDCRGFTLLELLISITLISVLVVILSTAIRSGMRAWTRGKEINQRLIAASAVEGLIGRQLRAIVRGGGAGIGGGVTEIGNFSELVGEENEISFVTTHVPMGSQAGGVFRVIYRFDEDQESLVYGQRILTRRDDLEETLPDSVEQDDREDLAEEGWDVSVLPVQEALSFSFTQDPDEEADPEDWADSWDAKGKIPGAVALVWTRTDETGEKRRTWRVFSTTPLVGGSS